MKIKIIAVFIVSIFAFSCNKETGTKPIVQDIKELVFASGTLEWKNSYNLTAQTDGVLKNVDFEIGDAVAKDKVLARIENNTNLVNTQIAKEQLTITTENLSNNSPALQQVQQNIVFATAKHNQDQLQAERYERLYKTQSVAKAEYENYKLAAENSLTNLKVLKNNYAQLKQQAKQNYITTKGQLENNKVAQQYNNIVVPQYGTVIEKLKTNGDFVKKGDVIATIADAKLIQAVLNVDETNIGKIKLGQTAYVKLNTDDSKIYNAKITEILASFDQKSQSFICKAVFEEPLNKAFFGTQLEANIFIKEKKNALLIPRNLMDFGNRVNVKGKDDYVIVKTGIISSDFVEILAGITKDDVILPLKH
ncbi:HlyD family efflux transporter periplasmic adaptor subunit [Pedobacter changchengzhani]|uniref:HlyD family efflux transporter periplasmic adaptor subunit n=1 Tax=Pedobacter changchengzhani TaxID=2529274 RepID=A0A4R5MJ30_9SPHI|nr:HlyD family efflux transporter periplasmic adaptor subunit [Pedobacter changchengzhani]TDG35570.1 HlyD family efflux transporter periplasmic adaptor subunit [Pedobacter changchengzhani]